MLTRGARSPLAITLSVWKALFLREALSRLLSRRDAWLWLLLEPVIHIAFIVFLLTSIRMRFVGGIDAVIWVMIGLLAFFMFQRTGTQVMNAISANQALFAYRQVRPVDTVIVRGVLECLLMILISAILAAGAGLFGHDVIPTDPLTVLSALFGLWIFGLGYGLMTSVASELIPELGKVIGLMIRPLYVLSGVIWPIASVSQPYRDWLLLNPIVHGLEAARLGFAPYYHAAPELNLAYLYGTAMITVFVGLALHVRFANKLVMQ